MSERWIYVNYIRDDETAARKLKELIEEKGFATLLAEDVIRPIPGERLRPKGELEKARRYAIARAWCVLAIYTDRRAAARREADHRDLADSELEWWVMRASGSRLVIPVRVLPCELPDFLLGIHPADLFEEGGVSHLMDALRRYYSRAVGKEASKGPAAAYPAGDEPDTDVTRPLPSPAPPADLIDACLAGDCVLYAGAGLAAAAGYPTWSDFVARMLDWAADAKVLTPGELRKLKPALLGAGELDLVADAIVRAVERGSREADLHAFLGRMFEPGPEVLPQRYAALQQLGLSAVLTTNFDTLLERTFSRELGSALTPNDTEALLQALSSKEFFIGKLYGRPTDPESLILTPTQYEEAIARNEAFGQFMESLFVSRTLLFLGCSLKGILDYLGGLRLKGTSRSHYALVGVSGDVWETQAQFLKDRYGIQVIPFAAGEDQLAVDTFVGDLGKAIAARRPEPAGDLPSQSRGSAREGSVGLIREVRLQNIGVFKDLRLALDSHWNLLLGDNGVGKSTVLRAIALAFCGRDGREYAARLLSAEQTSGRISLRTDRQEYVTELSLTRSGVEVKSHPDRPLELEGWLVLGFPALRALTWRPPRIGSDDEGRGRPVPQDLLPLLSGDPDPRLDEVKDWIVSLDYWMHRGGTDSGRIQDFRDGLFDLLAEVTRSPGLRFDRVDSQGNRVMVAADGLSIPIEALSQGTASLLGWLGVLVRRLFQVSGGDADALTRRALVLVDELDAHMHPAWQQILTTRLGERFPNVQFLATTHSPLLVAGLDPGQVVRFRRIPDKGVVAEPPPHGLKGVGVAGLLTSELFSLTSQLDPQTEAMLARKRELAAKDDLAPEETMELKELDERLGRVDFTTAVRDPLYARFVQAMAELHQQEADAEGEATAMPNTPERHERQRTLAREVLKDLLAKERAGDNEEGT